jgi:hypothetical protein
MPSLYTERSIYRRSARLSERALAPATFRISSTVVTSAHQVRLAGIGRRRRDRQSGAGARQARPGDRAPALPTVKRRRPRTVGAQQLTPASNAFGGLFRRRSSRRWPRCWTTRLRTICAAFCWRRGSTHPRPMLEQVERGEMPDATQARAKRSEMAGLIDRAMQAGQRGLPPGNARSSNRLEFGACLTAG